MTFVAIGTLRVRFSSIYQDTLKITLKSHSVKSQDFAIHK